MVISVYYAVQGGSNFESVDGKGAHSIKYYGAILSCGTVYSVVQSGFNF